MSNDGFKYWSFIGYSHLDNREDGTRWGDWLHQATETFQIPAALVGKIGRYGYAVPVRMSPSFLDKAELAATFDLHEDIRTALSKSRFLVVICSPHSANSRYVNQEVLEFKRLGRADRILCLVIAGEPNATDAAMECFPPALRHPLGLDGELDTTQPTVLPLWINMRGMAGSISFTESKIPHHAFEAEKLRLFAGLLGISFEELVQRDRERQLQEARRPGTLNLDVQPSGAHIEIAEASLGSTLSQVSTTVVFTASSETISKELAPGVYAITVQSRGFTDEKREVEIKSLHEKSLSIHLQHHRGTLNAESLPLGSTIEVDGKGWGSPINALPLDTGMHRLVARAENCFEKEAYVNILKDQQAVVQFTLEEGIQWKYASPALQGGLAFLPACKAPLLIAHNELSRIIFVSAANGEIKHEMATPEGNRRAFAQVDLGGSLGNVIVSGLDTENRGPELLVISSDVPPKMLWQWNGPVSRYQQSAGLAVTVVRGSFGVADLAVSGRDGHIYILDGTTGRQRHDIVISDRSISDVQLTCWKIADRLYIASVFTDSGHNVAAPEEKASTVLVIDARAGTVLWRENFGRAQNAFLPETVFNGLPLVLLWSNEAGLAMDARTGKPLSKGSLPAPPIAGPALLDIDGRGSYHLVFEFAEGKQALLIIEPVGNTTRSLDNNDLSLNSNYQPRGPGNTLQRIYNGDILIVLNDTSSHKKGLAAVNPADGSITWLVPGRPRGALVANSVRKDDTEIFVTMLDEGLLCLNSLGTTRWKLRLREDVRPWALLHSNIGSPPGILIHRHAGSISLAHRPSLLWKVNASAALQATPVVVSDDNEKAVVIQTGPWGNDISLRGFDGGSGIPRWSAEEHFAPNRGPAVVNMDDDSSPNIVAIGSSRHQPGNRLFVYRAVDGKLMRSLPIMLNQQPWGGWQSCTPAVAGYRVTNKSDVAVNNWDDRSIVLIDGLTGEIVWRYLTNGPNMGGVTAYDLDGDGLCDVLSPSFDGHLYALRGKDGTLIWKAPIYGGSWSVPVIATLDGDGIPYVITTTAIGRLLVLDGRTGNACWSPDVTGEMKVTGKAAVVQEGSDTTILAPLGKSGVVAFSWISRQEMWRSPKGFPVVASPLICDLLRDGKMAELKTNGSNLYRIVKVCTGGFAPVECEGCVDAWSPLPSSHAALPKGHEGCVDAWSPLPTSCTCHRSGRGASPMLSRNASEKSMLSQTWRMV